MFELALENLRANKGRLAATVVAIVIGVAFLASGLMFTDAIRSTLGGTVEQQYALVDAQVTDSGERQGPPARLPANLLASVRDLSQVREAAGELEGDVGIFKPGRRKPTTLTGRLWVDGSLGALEIVQGEAPRAAGEFVVDQQTADELGLDVGTRIKLSTATGARTATLVGISAFGDQDAQDFDGTASFPKVDAFDTLTAGLEEYTRIIVDGRDGVAQPELRSAISGVAPDGTRVTGRTQFLEDAQGATAAFAEVLRPFLTGFAYLAMFICGFVIANTFAVVLAQRLRELALLRAIGATPRQVRWSLRLEALGIGLVASIVGIAVGFGLAMGATAVLDAFDIVIPGAGAKLSLGTIALCLVTGVGVTVASVIGASLDARARVAPVEAMRSTALETPPKRRSAWWLGVLVIGGGVLLYSGFEGNAWGLGSGALLFIIGLLRSGPILTRWLAGGLIRATRRRSMTTRLAIENLARNPKRAATTSNALVIGVLLVTLVTTAGGTLRDQLVDSLNDLSGTDLLITTDGSSFPEGVIDDARRVDGVEQIAPIVVTSAQVDGIPTTVASGDVVDVARAAGIKVLSGSLAELAGDELAVVDGAAFGGQARQIGDPIEITTLEGRSATFRVGATIEFNISALFVQNLMSSAAFEELFGADRPPTQAFVRVSDRSVREVRDDLELLTDSYSTVRVTEGNFLAELVGQVLDVVIYVVYGLLAMSVLIAVIGIVNTMTLAILERRREFGLLRAVGMMPREAMRMVATEAVVIAVYGTVLGILAGVFVGFALTRSLETGPSEAAAQFSFEWATLGVIAIIGVIAGLFAAIIPAVRVARLDVLRALEE